MTQSRTSRPVIIALVGIDGSGKTTQARMLADWLTRSGRPARYWQNAGGRRWLGVWARRLGANDAQDLLGRPVLLAVEATLRWLAIARAVIRSRLSGQIAVMDRYAVCQLVSVRAHGGYGTVLGRAAYRVFPRPDLTIFLDVKPEVAYQRIVRRGTDKEQYQFLAAGARIYPKMLAQQTMLAQQDVVAIDGNRSPSVVCHDVRNAVAPIVAALRDVANVVHQQ